MTFHPAVLVKNEVILGVDRDLLADDDDKLDFSYFLFLFLRGEEGGGGVTGCWFKGSKDGHTVSNVWGGDEKKSAAFVHVCVAHLLLLLLLRT
jgi:hypothetical protein